MIERASPRDILDALTIARELSEAGVLFVPIPVTNKMERLTQQLILDTKLREIQKDLK